MNKKLFITLAILAFITSCALNSIIKGNFYRKNVQLIKIPQLIYQNTSFNDDFAKYINSSQKYIYCAKDDRFSNYLSKGKCKEIQNKKISKKYILITENLDDIKNKKCSDNSENCLSYFVRKNCSRANQICIFNPSKKSLASVSSEKSDYIEMALYDFR